MGCGAHTGGSAPAAFEPQEPKATTGMIHVEVQAIPKRGIREETARLFRYGYGDVNGQKCQVAQYMDARGRPVAQKLRFAGKQFSILGNGKRMPLFGAHLWRDGGKMVVVTEGELDALSVSQIQNDRWPVVSIPNGAQGAKKSIEENLEWLEKFERVVLMFDDDAPGKAAAEECAAVLTPGKAFIATIKGHKDANEALQKGDGKAVVDAMWGAKPWRPDSVVGFADAWQRVLGRPNVPAIPIPHAGLQDMLLGLREGEITTLVAGTGAGKSTLMREIAAAVAQSGVKIGYIGLEEGVERSALGLVSVLVDRPLHLETFPDLKTPAVQAATATLEKQVVFYDAFGSLDPENLIARMRFMAKGEGAKVIFLDHLTIVTSGGELDADERRVLDRMMTSLVKFTQETKVHVITIAHLSRTMGQAHEEGGRVTLKNIRGTHGIAQLSHNVVALERDQQATGDADVTTIRVLKNRHAGRTGLAGRLKYDPATGRSREHIMDAPFDDTGTDSVE